MGFHIGTSRWASDSDTLLESSVATSVVETKADPNNNIDDELETELEWNTESKVKYTGDDNQHRGDYTVSTQINGIVDYDGGNWVGELEERAGFRMTLKPKPSEMDIDIEDCRAFAQATRKEWGWIFDSEVEETTSMIPFQ
ncbi:hypothetical protein JT359_04670 [Candidatus Poribacteria bacterium]|nr:hypothetical protein [Candidatus Poribacteria bacterium]